MALETEEPSKEVAISSYFEHLLVASHLVEAAELEEVESLQIVAALVSMPSFHVYQQMVLRVVSSQMPALVDTPHAFWPESPRTLDLRASATMVVGPEDRWWQLPPSST